MERQDFILATLCSNPEHKYSPVQLQKLFFLIDRLLSKKIGKEFFHFEPYHYGPFDQAVYEELNILYIKDLIEINKGQYGGYNANPGHREPWFPVMTEPLIVSEKDSFLCVNYLYNNELDKFVQTRQGCSI